MPAALAFLFLLFASARVPLHRQFRSEPGGIPVFVVSNGFHTDLVVPVREARTGLDWRPRLAAVGAAGRLAAYPYVGFGWGSEGFFLASYGGHLPGPGTVARALVPGPTLMHVDFYRAPPRPGWRVVSLELSEAQYRQLTTELARSFRTDSAGGFVPRTAAGYTPDDFFFRATGRYHALRTCNDWTVRTLRRTGVRVPLKSPLAGPVLRQLRRSRAAE